MDFTEETIDETYSRLIFGKNRWFTRRIWPGEDEAAYFFCKAHGCEFSDLYSALIQKLDCQGEDIEFRLADSVLEEDISYHYSIRKDEFSMDLCHWPLDEDGGSFHITIPNDKRHRQFLEGFLAEYLL